MANNQLRPALRRLGRHKGYTAINILGLSLGLCACIVIYHIVSYEFSFDRSHPYRERIYRIGCRITEDHGNGAPVVDYGENIPAPAPEALRAGLPAIETLAAYYSYEVSITIPVLASPASNKLQLSDHARSLPPNHTVSSSSNHTASPSSNHTANPSSNHTKSLPPNHATILAGPEWFDIFPYTFLAGNPVQSLSQPNGVVLTASRACDYFGEMPAKRYLGRELIYDDSLRVRVSGIIQDYQGNTDFPYTDYISFATISHSFLKTTYRQDQWRFNPGIPGIQAFVKLRKGVGGAGERGEDEAQPGGKAQPGAEAQPGVQAQFDAILQRHIADDAFLQLLKLHMVLQPLGDVHFNEAYNFDGIRKASRPALMGLSCAAVFVLLLAIVNFINLSTAQSLQLVNEIGIRRILGASRLRLLARSLTETAILTILSAILAMALARPVMALFQSCLPESLPFRVLDAGMIGFIAGIVILTTLVAGLYPAIQIAGFGSYRLSGTIGVLTPQRGQKLALRRILIVFQFSISLLFIIAALVVGRQINYMLDADMGFNSASVVTVTSFSTPPQQLRLFAREALQIPGVEETIIQGHAPAGAPTIENPMRLDNRSDKELEVNILNGGPQFVSFYRMRLLAGRNLLSGDSIREFLINDTYRKFLGFATPEDALSHFITWQGKTLRIVGVVADFHTNSLHSAISSLVIGRIANLDNSVGLRIALNNHQTLPRLEALWKSLIPDQSFSYSFLDDSIAKLYKKDRQLSWLLGVTTGVTIFVSCIGLLGLILFIVERKKKEISIRKVLGAGIADIVLLLNREFILLVGIALAIASPIAYLGLHRWLSDFAYRITISCWTFVLAGMMAVLISLLTISLRVIRAALANPTDNLRSE